MGFIFGTQIDNNPTNSQQSLVFCLTTCERSRRLRSRKPCLRSWSDYPQGFLNACASLTFSLCKLDPAGLSWILVEIWKPDPFSEKQNEPLSERQGNWHWICLASLPTVFWESFRKARLKHGVIFFPDGHLGSSRNFQMNFISAKYSRVPGPSLSRERRENPRAPPEQNSIWLLEVI